MRAHTPEPKAWWQHLSVWLLLAGPLAVVMASFATLWLAASHADPVVGGPESRSTAAAAKARTPALQARNHAVP